jgi:hypothetical protein
MSISTYLRPNIHQNGPEILGVKSRRTLIMIYRAFTTSTKYYLMLVPLNKHKAMDFVEVVFETALMPYYYHHTNYEYFIFTFSWKMVHLCIVGMQQRFGKHISG